jgi:hypothetical protein
MERYELEEPEAKQAVKLLLSEGEWFARLKLRHGGALDAEAATREAASPTKASQVRKALMMAASVATAESFATGCAIYAK